MQWRIYYGDGTVEVGNGHPRDNEGAIRGRDVQVIVQEQPEIGWHTQTGSDYYVWREEQGRWVGVDRNGLYDWLLDRGDFLQGRTLSKKQYQAVMKRAMADFDDIKKTGYLRDERQLDE
jgi:hypothetical protein